MTAGLVSVLGLAACAGRGEWPVADRTVSPRSGVGAAAQDARPCAGATAYSELHHGTALLVMRDGALLCEVYAQGAGPSKPHPLFSGSKGLSGLMAAAAAGDGLLTLDEKVSDTLVEWKSDPLKSNMTIRDLLALSSGLETSGPRAAPGYAEAAATPAIHPPGTVFQYGPIVFQVFGEVMSRKLRAAGRSEGPSEYIERRVLAPIGAKVAAWGGPTAGPDPNLAAGAQMTAADWLKVGELMRRPEEARRVGLALDAYEAQGLPQGAYRGYGLAWWLATPLPASASDGLDPVARTIDLPQGAMSGYVPKDLVVAAGAGGQRLYVSRSARLVIVRLADPARLAAQFARARTAEARAAAAVRSAEFSDTEFIRRVIADLAG